MLNLALSPAPLISKQVCLDCHKKVLDQRYKHVAAEKDCANCHLSNGKTHPEEGVKGFTLVGETPELCLGCHNEIRKVLKEASHRHPVMTQGKNCLNCHSPHASAEKHLLIEDETKNCIECHNKSVSQYNKPIRNIRQLVLSNTYTHGDISKSGCSGCHNPHGSPNLFMMIGSYPEGVYTSANKESFLVCFTCHNSKLLLDESTKTATGFRNGTENLHYFHIHGSKTRICNSCHNVHGAMNSQLIADKVPFGTWEMPIHFKTIENGGSCTPGCHAEKVYRR